LEAEAVLDHGKSSAQQGSDSRKRADVTRAATAVGQPAAISWNSDDHLLFPA
jgi:hypothetical protein